MITKYTVPISQSIVEFSDMKSAIDYSITNSIDTGSISTISESVFDVTGSSEYIFSRQIEAGYNVPGTPYYLALKDNDRSQFIAFLGLINEALSLGLIDMNTTQSIQDKDNNTITMTTSEFKQLMVGYGFYYKTIWNNKHSI